MENLTADSYLEGQVLFIDKPLTWTSFDVVNKIRMQLRKSLGIKKIKVGHAGTLDPLATGLVIICTGRATKQIMQYQDLEKAYTANVTLGTTTPSYDLETEFDGEYPWQHIDRKLLNQALDQFRGEQDQVPPIFSAKSVDGKRAYNMARKGQTIELKSNRVTISELDVLRFEAPEVDLHVACSKGTYIRSLAHDLGKALESGAHLSGLRRTRIGPYQVDDAFPLEDFLKKLKLS